MRTSKTTSTPTISVVIATYNRGVLLNSLLNNLDKQTMNPAQFEVIVVDDGSMPPADISPGEWTFSFQLIRQENGGAAAARHNGIKHSRGKIIVIVDDDMALTTTFLDTHLKAHENGADVALGRVVQSEDFESMPLHNRFQQHQFNRSFDDWRSQETLPGAILYTGNVSIQRQLYDAVGGFDLSLKQNEDRELGIRLEKAGARIVFAENAITINGSDHTDLGKWLESSKNYGILDWKISRVHNDVENVDPFHFLFLVNPLSRPILSAVLLAPGISPYLSRSVMAASQLANTLNLDKVALSGTTLAYGIQYFRGVRDEAGSLREIIKGGADYLKKRFHSK